MKVVVVLLAAFLAACAQVELKPPAGPLEFSLAGRIAARSGKEAFTGNISWRHAREGDEMLITTPTGQGVAQIIRQGDAVVLKTSEPREYRAADSEELTERVLGFRLPIEGLAETVQGKPSPALEGRGWKVEYQEFDEQRRPTRLRLTNAGAEVRLAIHQWN
ncbi:MAG TPA: outer membrane lipoprotein LolB [Burkholderiales bacterium]|nr:outer membrane lipoprotein LolB [Burkholderiales bacterium]